MTASVSLLDIRVAFAPPFCRRRSYNDEALQAVRRLTTAAP
jgi:hypothetical protein